MILIKLPKLNCQKYKLFINNVHSDVLNMLLEYNEPEGEKHLYLPNG